MFLDFFFISSLSFSLIRSDNLDVVIHHGFNISPYALLPLPEPNNRNDLGLGTRLEGNRKGEREMKKKEERKRGMREMKRQEGGGTGSKKSLINQDKE